MYVMWSSRAGSGLVLEWECSDSVYVSILFTTLYLTFLDPCSPFINSGSRPSSRRGQRHPISLCKSHCANECTTTMDPWRKSGWEMWFIDVLCSLLSSWSCLNVYSSGASSTPVAIFGHMPKSRTSVNIEPEIPFCSFISDWLEGDAPWHRKQAFHACLLVVRMAWAHTCPTWACNFIPVLRRILSSNSY